MLVLLLAALTAGCSSPAPTAASGASAAPVPVKVEVVAPGALDHTEDAVGLVVTRDSVEVRPEMTGLVATINFKDGAAVKRGQVLVRLRDNDAEAGLMDARARAKLAAVSLERAKALRGRDEVAQADLDNATANDALARAAVLKAEETLRRTTIVAPFDGVVGRRDVSVGELVDPSRVLTRVEALGSLSVDVTLAEGALASVAPEQAATVELPALGLKVDGTVRYVSPRVREDSRTVDVRVDIQPNDERVRPGMSANVQIVTARVADALLIPTQAIVPGATQSSVWVLGADGIVAPRPIKTGQRLVDRIEVTEGLAVGDQVIVEGLSRMRPGVAAKVQTP